MLGLCVSASYGADAHPQNTSGADETKELRAEVGRLRQEVKSLREQVQSATQPHTAAQPAAAAPTVPFGDAMRDAEHREPRMDMSDLTAGWSHEHGFFIRSDDGNFQLSPFSLFQVRGATAVRQHANPGASDDTQSGFEIRRLQFGLDGHVFSPDFTYRLFWQSSELTTGNLSLLMAWVQYRFHNTPWVIGGGQFKDPFDHEQLLGDANQLAADRTFVDDILAGGEAFSRGVSLRYDDHGPFRAEGALTSGFNVPNVGFQPFPTNSANYGLAARGEYKLFGNWRDYEQFSSQGDRENNLLVVGAGVDYTEAGHTDFLRHTFDAQFNAGPLGLYGACLGRYTRGNTAGRGGDTYDPTLRAQVSYLLTPKWEIFGRYDYVHFDGLEFKTPTKSTVHEITAGATYYFFGQNAKITLDVSYLPNGTPTADAGNDILANSGRGELVARGQFQLLL